MRVARMEYFRSVWRPRARRVLALLALVALSAAAQKPLEVTIRNYRFSPHEIRIKSGDSVKWINAEKRTSHSVLFPAENGLESERLFPEESWKRTFKLPGTYKYRCGPHEEMTGVVIVEQALGTWQTQTLARVSGHLCQKTRANFGECKCGWLATFLKVEKARPQ